MSLEHQEIQNLTSKIGRTPTHTEIQIVSAEWSEHCSYKSSKKHLKMLPMDGPRVINEKGYDSGVLDVGDGYIITAHIESHNHPSAVEPYGGAATGVGGVIRDILSAGTRPIAILNGLRFGDIKKDANASWLFKNAVTGIADYGNCLGIPTIGGEVEFDSSYSNYALVDVAAIGFGKKENMIINHADMGDVVVLLGGHTGRDGIGGSQFASDSLESENRSAVQIPDPFIEKMIIEAVLEARNQGLIHAMKDLGGGGLSCAISEMADALSVGMYVDVDMVHTREHLTHDEIMTSESQERMLIITEKSKLEKLHAICSKFRITSSVIGHITDGDIIHITHGDMTCASLPASVVANAELLDRDSQKPHYLEKIQKNPKLKPIINHTETFFALLTSPNIASKAWVYRQYDHEVGIRTVIKPGMDASVLRLDNGKFLSIKIDGNPKHCYINPKEGAIGCFEEACRNVACTGGTPIGMLDHMQFGSPKDPEIFWTFLESLKGISEYAKYFKIPCVGGKVSMYNETPDGPIKPTPIIGVIGLSGKRPTTNTISTGDYIIIVGKTLDEMGGSEYMEYIHGVIGGICPTVNFAESKKNMDAVIEAVNYNMTSFAHDCSKGGIAVAISEMSISSGIGCNVMINDIPGCDITAENIIYSESHSRYILAVNPDKLNALQDILKNHGVMYGVIGRFTGDMIVFSKNKDIVINTKLDVLKKAWEETLEEMIRNG